MLYTIFYKHNPDSFAGGKTAVYSKLKIDIPSILCCIQYFINTTRTVLRRQNCGIQQVKDRYTEYFTLYTLYHKQQLNSMERILSKTNIG